MIEQLDITNSNKKLHISITYGDGQVIELTEEDVKNSNSVSINNKCVSGNDFQFGSVYAAECTFSFGSDVDRYMLYDAKVAIRCGNGTESIGKGVYYVSEAIRQGKYIQITAYDGMIKLDVDVLENMTGTVYQILAFMGEKCGVELSQTEEEINSLTNATYLYTVSMDTVQTWRDVLYYLAGITCTFAEFEGEGKLRLQSYHAETDLEIDKNGRSNPSVADYEIYYDAIKARFILNGEYKQYSLKQSDDATRYYDAGDFPIVRLLQEQQQAILANMLAEVIKIKYVPVTAKIRFNPFIELGDRIKLLDTNNKGDAVYSYVMSYEWSFRGSTKIKSIGSNQRLAAAKSKEEKQLQNLENTVAIKDVIVHAYTNVSAYTLGTKEKEIISINYAATADTHPVFIATIPFIVDADGYVVFNYYLDGVLMPDDTVRQYVERGEHFVTLSNNLTIEKDNRNTLSVRACTEYFESDARQQAAKILSFEDYISTGTYTEQEVDTTVPQATIAKGSIRAVLYAQGLAGTEAWDGTINISEYVSTIALDDVLPGMYRVNDKMAAGVQVPIGSGITEQVSRIAVPVDLFEFVAI